MPPQSLAASPDRPPWCWAGVGSAVAAVLVSQEGVATRAQLLTVMTPEALRAKLESARWQTPRPGVVVAHSGPLTPRQELWVHLLAAGEGAALAGLTAATLDGLRGYETARPVVLVPHGRQVRRPVEFVVRSTRRLGVDVHPLRAPRRTRLARSLVDAASWAGSADDTRAILAAGVQQRLVPADHLLAVVCRSPKLRGRRLILATLGDILGGAHSLPEIEFARMCRRFRIPAPSRQVVRRDSQGRRRWLDVFWDDVGLVVEIDGLFHMEAQPWWDDMDRNNDHTVVLEGLLRYPSFAILEHQPKVAEQILAALRSRRVDRASTG